jgi:carbohydrate-selective porin OprB
LINDKIEDALDDAAARSVEVGVDAAIVFQNVQQRSGSDTAADGNSYQLASADLFFTAGLAQYTVFFADIVGLSGTPPDAEIDTLNLLNGYTARLVSQNELNLREAWLMTEVFEQRLLLAAGRVDLTSFFDHNAAANDESSQFVSDPLVNNPMLGLSENGAGLAAVYDPKNGFTAKLGYQQSSSDATNLSDSLFYLAEVGQLWNPFHIGEGNYRAWYRKDNSSGMDREAYGVSIDQRVSPVITLFGRYGSADAETTEDDEFFSAGLQFRNGLTFNPDDVWGIGYTRTELGAGDEEDLFEAYYNIAVTEKLALSFHLTHVTEEPVGSEKVSYLVPGVRLQASF